MTGTRAGVRRSRAGARTSAVLILLFGRYWNVTDGQHSHTDSFPPDNEYDYQILDPNAIYGSPYGGFGRAVTSRLAALPLHLPYLTEDSPRVDPLYMQIRDAQGRLFACRVYHEDELDPTSLEESMFDAPRFRVSKDDAAPVASDDSADTNERMALEDDEASTGQVDTGSGDAASSLALDKASDDSVAEGAALEEVQVSVDGQTQQQGSSPLSDLTEEVGSRSREEPLAELDIDAHLSALEGVCSVLHLGWWSYEWCYKKHVSQFHIHVSKEENAIRVEDFSKLGEFDTRTRHVDLKGADANTLAEGRQELARVIDYHTDGDLCPDTDEERTSVVQFLCCSDDVMVGRKGQQAQATDSDDPTKKTRHLAAVHSVYEPPNQICTYVLTVCTPLLCVDEERDRAKRNATNTKKRLAKKDNESVREILARTLGEQCLQASDGGWWTYEFCHGDAIRQYHEVVGQHKIQSGVAYATRVIESEHILGKYQEEEAESFPNEDEWKLVVNATQKEKAGGNGACYELEYAGGDICDSADVTDSAVIAGGAGSGGISRSSTVRYFCGAALNVAVSEDSTCHYVVEVTVPDLCEHVLFKAPVMKKQVVKCLPVADA